MSPAEAERVALVTGGLGDLGRAIATRLAADGTRVVLADVRSPEPSSTPGFDSLVIDVGDESSVAAGTDMIVERYGRLDILVNNAGVAGLQDGRRSPLADMRLDTWSATLLVNLTGVFLMSRAAIALMRPRGWGRIVNISSRSARMNPGISNANYAASKAGVLGMARVLASELGGTGITVNSVAPSRIVTGMTLAAAPSPGYFHSAAVQTPAGRLGEPDDVANAVAFYCAEASSFLTGTILDVAGGSFMP